MAFRTIDARGIWRGDPEALDVFARAYGLDCGGDDATWHRVYGWTPAALEQAKARAFPNMRPDPADSKDGAVYLDGSPK